MQLLQLFQVYSSPLASRSEFLTKLNSDLQQAYTTSKLLGINVEQHKSRLSMALTCMQTKMQIGSTQQLARASVRTPFVAAPSQLARSRQAFVVRAEQDTRDRGAQKLDNDSYQSAHRLSSLGDTAQYCFRCGTFVNSCFSLRGLQGSDMPLS